MKNKHHLLIAQTLAKLLDSQFAIGRFKFGLDPILGLVPWAGDILGLIFSLYLFWLSYRLKLPKVAKSLILRNIIIDFVFGAVPFVGDIGDFVFKSNKRNWEIIQKYSKINVVEDVEVIK